MATGKVKILTLIEALALLRLIKAGQMFLSISLNAKIRLSNNSRWAKKPAMP